jgi:signal transduction histidine kinase
MSLLTFWNRRDHLFKNSLDRLRGREGPRISDPQCFSESTFSEAGQKTGDDLTADPNLQTSSSAESSGINSSFTDSDQFELMKHRKRGVEIMAVCIGIPVLFVLALNNLIRGHLVQTFLCSFDLLIAVLLGFMTKRKTDEEFEYKIYSILFRLFIAVIGIAILHQIGFHSNFYQIEWSYVFPILVFLAVGSIEGMIWVFVFYGILAFFILNFDLQKIMLSEIQEWKYRFLVSFFVVSMLSLSLQHGFRFAQQRLLTHQRDLKESENRYRQAYEQLNSEMQERKKAEEALQRSEGDAKRLAQENATMAEIGRIISSTLNIEEVYPRFVEEVRKLISFDRIVINLIDIEKGVSLPLYIAGKEIGDRKKGDVCLLEGSGNAEMVRTKSSLLIQTEDFNEYKDRFPMLLSTFQAGFRSILDVPLFSKGQVIGGLLLRSLKPYIYTDKDMRLAERVGDQIAGAIANAHLFTERMRAQEAAKRLSQENATVAEIGRIISSTLEINEVYERFAEMVHHLIDFDRVAIATFNMEHQTATIAYAIGKEIPERRLGKVFPLSQSIYEHILKTRSSLLVQTEDACEIEYRFPFLRASFQSGFKSVISVPLISKDQVIGVLNFRSVKPNAYTERDLKTAESIGNQIAGAIANTLLFDERKRMEVALREKTEELARSNKDLEQFAYVASHDLQEPLRMVTSYLQLLVKRYGGKLDADANEFIDFAVDGAVRMRKLINDLLAYSRVGTQGKELSPTDCEAVLVQSINDLKIIIEENGAHVTHDPLPTVMADRPQLGQLFQNLIGNAIKFRGNEPPRVHISASRNGSGWVFSVRDNGIGIPSECSERIFIIFQRLHNREEYAGTGIGLAICKKIVERHGGHIWVESEVGKGTTFRFSLQAARA